MPRNPADLDWVADTDLFRQAFRRYATTVVIVTYFDADGRASGMTATSMCSLSPSPPSLLVCINRSSRAHAEITDRGRYGVNLLSVEQRSVALHCSRVGGDKHLRMTGWRRMRPRARRPACSDRSPTSSAKSPRPSRCTRTRSSLG